MQIESKKKMTAMPVIPFETQQELTCLQTHRPDPEMMTSLLTILYEDLLIGGQVDVQTTVYEGLLKGEQDNVYTYRSSISCGTSSLNVPALQQLPACSSDVFGTSTRRCRNLRRTRKEGKVARRRTREK